jgi:hypothetical protein
MMMERSQQQQHKSTSDGGVEKAAAGETSSSSQHDELAAERAGAAAVAQEDSRAQTNDDPLAKALQTLFLNVTSFIQAELQVCFSLSLSLSLARLSLLFSSFFGLVTYGRRATYIPSLDLHLSSSSPLIHSLYRR